MQKKIMFFTPSLNIGGLERISLTYAKELAYKYDVYYSICHNSGAFTSELDMNVKVINLNTKHLRNSILRLSKVIRDIQPDYIITANDATMVALLSKWLSFTKTKVIAFQHSYITDAESNTLRSRIIIEIFFRRCDKIIAVSDGIRNMLVKSLGVPSYKVKVIFNPIDSDRILKLANVYCELPEDYIVFVGRLSRVKNIPLLIYAFKEYKIKNDSVKLIIVGDGEEKNEVSRLCLDLGLSNSVIMAGEQSNPYPYIKGARVVALSSSSEALPTVLIESLVLGKTIVSTPTSGAKEILGDDLGYIVDSFDDPKIFARGIETAFKNQIASNVLTRASLHYNLSAQVSEFAQILK